MRLLAVFSFALLATLAWAPGCQSVAERDLHITESWPHAAGAIEDPALAQLAVEAWNAMLDADRITRALLLDTLDAALAGAALPADTMPSDEAGRVRAVQERLRTDPSLHFRTRDEVEQVAVDSLARARVAMGDWFGLLPQAPCEVVRIAAHEERETTMAYYRGPAADGSLPGRYYINTYAPETRPRCEAEEALDSAFDIRDFHDVVLGSGAVSPGVLRRKVEEWIAATRSGRSLGQAGPTQRNLLNM